MIVMKFGGTSVRDAEAIRRVAHIVGSQPHVKRVVVVSALGGVTNDLIALAKAAAEGKLEDCRSTVEALRTRHLRIARELSEPDTGDSCQREISDTMDQLLRLAEGVVVLGEATPRTSDAFASMGEHLSSLLVHQILRSSGILSAWVDARRLLVTDDAYTRARPDIDRSRGAVCEILSPLFEHSDVVVTQGFVGSTPAGVTTTLGRGGSDYSASLIGSFLGADEIQIWTDVDGILTADPSVVPEARNIGSMSFREASELSYFGARVLHPDTILPAIHAGIPVVVKNSTRPDAPGTRITETNAGGNGVVKSIAYKEGITLLSVVSARMFLAHGFLARVFDVFDRHRTVVHAVASSEVSITAAIDDTRQLSSIVEELRAYSTVSASGGKAIVCVVGEGLAQNSGIAGRLLAAAGEVEVNMISQGASEINIGFVIDEREIDGVVHRLHGAFFEQQERRASEVYAPLTAQHSNGWGDDR